MKQGIGEEQWVVLQLDLTHYLVFLVDQTSGTRKQTDLAEPGFCGANGAPHSGPALVSSDPTTTVSADQKLQQLGSVHQPTYPWLQPCSLLKRAVDHKKNPSSP